jgi:hypothetical protein
VLTVVKDDNVLLRMGGNPPQDLILPMTVMRELASNPSKFILAIPLNPGHNFTREEISKMESIIKVPEGTHLDRKVGDSAVIWTVGAKYSEEAWARKPIEGITCESSPYIMGGSGAFWPLPIQRHGSLTIFLWKSTLPEDTSSAWMLSLEEAMKGRMGVRFWTLSKRYDLDCTSPFTTS